ncbi:MAG: MBL fold metallo-hydrolase [Thermoanaerobaculia bacterium]
MIRNALISAVILFAASFTAAQVATPAAAGTGVTIEKLTANLHVIRGAGGNIAVLSGDEGVLLVDSGTKSAAPEVMEAIRSISDKPVRYVIYTHWHPDHTGGGAEFGAGATIIAHDSTRAWLKSGGVVDLAPVPPAEPTRNPTVTIQHETRLYMNGETVQILPLSGGHSNGDLVVSFTAANVIHVGDAFYPDRFPYIDTDSGASVRQLGLNLSYLTHELSKSARVIAGHGPTSTVDAMVRYQQMISDTSSVVALAKRRGETVEAMKKNRVLDQWNSWAWDGVSTDRFIEILDLAMPTIRPRGSAAAREARPETPASPAPKRP